MLLLDRKLTADSAAAISPADRGFLLGDGVFDTVKIENGVVLDGPAHMHRLLRHAALIGIMPPVTAEDLCADMIALIAANEAQSGVHALRTTLSRGEGPRGLAPPDIARPTLLMRLAPYQPPQGPARACIALTIRRNEFSPLSQIKSLNYGDNMLALMEAKARDCDDAILLNTHGNVACATAGTVFVEQGDGVLATPPLNDGVMDGITRAKLIEMGRCVEKSMTEQDLAASSTIYIGNSLTGLRPITLIGSERD